METSPIKTKFEKEKAGTKRSEQDSKNEKIDFTNFSNFNPFQTLNLFRSVFAAQGFQEFPSGETSSQARSNDSIATTTTTTTMTTRSNDSKVSLNQPSTNVTKGKRKVCRSNDKMQTAEQHSSSSSSSGKKKKENKMLSADKKQKLSDEISIPSISQSLHQPKK